jgi:hypothetical protein
MLIPSEIVTYPTYTNHEEDRKQELLETQLLEHHQAGCIVSTRLFRYVLV